MIKIVRSHLLRLSAATALLLAASLAHAQYAWIDEKGVRHFSDRPPPPATPADKIIKAPGKPTVKGLLQEDAPAEPKALATAKADAKPTLAELEADFRKRTQESAKQEQKASAEAQQNQAKAENCNNARRYKSLLESGIRVADTGADGERAYISEDERQKRLAKSNAVLATCN
jgi:cell pole-organizing protein PopZ